jgi:hypothetical protein
VCMPEKHNSKGNLNRVHDHDHHRQHIPIALIVRRAWRRQRRADLVL